MKVIIPLAGKGKRLRPHTHTRPKPMVHVAGKPVLGHILDAVLRADIKDVVLITGEYGDQIAKYAKKHYSFNLEFVEQTELKGQAHAIQLTKPLFNKDSDILIWFSDTITDANLQIKDKSDGLIFVKEVKDPRRYGQIKVDVSSKVLKIVEKADPPVSHLVNIGLYYFKSAHKLFAAIDELIEQGQQTEGEYYLMDAVQLMIDKGAKFTAKMAKVWEDTGTPETLLKTNKYFLDNGRHKEIETHNSVINKPVYLEQDVVVENSVIGPYVSVAAGTVIKNSIIKNSIINENSFIEEAKLTDSLVGEKAVVKGAHKRLNVGDNSEVLFG